MRQAGEFGLDVLFDPLGAKGFFEEVHEQRHLHLHGRPAAYDGLWSMDDHEQYLWANRHRVATLGGVTVRSKNVEIPRTLDGDNFLTWLGNQYRDGATLVLRNMGQVDPHLGAFQRRIEAELYGHISINAYLTPPGATGFTPHFDTHDTVILQVHGEKQWQVFGCHSELPSPAQGASIDAAALEVLGPPVDELRMRPGDLLYLPRGQVHTATSGSDEPSLHLTLGLHLPIWADVIHAAVDRLTAENPWMRRHLLPTPVAPGDDVAEQRILDAAAALVASAADLAPNALGRVRFATIGKLLTFPDKVLDPSMEAEVPGLDELVRRRPSVAATVVVVGDQAEIRFPGSRTPRVSGPAEAAETLLAVAASTEPFTVRSLGGALPERTRHGLVHRLLVHGVLERVPPPGADPDPG